MPSYLLDTVCENNLVFAILIAPTLGTVSDQTLVAVCLLSRVDVKKFSLTPESLQTLTPRVYEWIVRFSATFSRSGVDYTSNETGRYGLSTEFTYFS